MKMYNIFTIRMSIPNCKGYISVDEN